MRTWITSITIAVAVLLATATTQAGTFEDGLQAYQTNDLELAQSFFLQAVQENSTNVGALTYLAETQRRLGQHEVAVENARAALALQNCNSFAHTILADAHNPIFSGWEYTDADRTWEHLLAAVACDSTDGNAWVGIWTEALRRGDREREVNALQALVKSGFLAPALLAYNRWVLRGLPANALLLTNGDMDTYPALALQLVEQLRPDVAIVNISLLNLDWYGDLVESRHGVPVGSFKPTPVNTPSRQVIADWFQRSREGKFQRPLTAALTVTKANLPSKAQDHLQMAGAHWNLLTKSPENLLDMRAIQASIERVDSQDFAGPWVSDKDRSPVRRSGTRMMVMNITAAALRYGFEIVESEGKAEETLQVCKWAEEFEQKTELGPKFSEQIAELRKKARDRSARDQ